MSFGRKALITFVAYTALCSFVLLPLSSHRFFAKYNGVLLILFTLAVIGVFYWIRKPSWPKTSVYQPMRLTKFSGDDRGIRRLGFKFSNKDYAQQFTRLNRRLINKEILEVR
jgi:hypothetical protein